MMDKQPIYDLATEKVVLTTFVRNPESIGDLSLLADDVFYSTLHRAMFQVIRKMAPAVDATTITRELEGQYDAGDVLMALDADCCLAALARHIEALQQMKVKRMALARAKKIIFGLANADATTIKAQLADAAREINSVSNDDEINALDRYLTTLEARARGERKGIPTGYPCLDYPLNGLLPGGFYVIAGRAKMGKTMFALNIADNLLMQGKRVLFVSLEMGTDEIYDLVFSRRMGINSKRLKMHAEQLHDVEWGAIVGVAGKLHDDRFIITRHGRTLGQVESAIISHAPDVVIVDNLNLMRGDTKYGSKVHEIGAITSGMKLMAGDHKLPIILIAQLNRASDTRDCKVPLPSDLRDSGSIEQDANAVIGVYRPGYYDRRIPQTQCEIIIMLNRSGESGSYPFRSDLETSTFTVVE